MKTIARDLKIVLFVTLGLMIVGASAPYASADHGDEAEVTTHATTVHEHDDTVSSTVTLVSAPSDVERMQKLVSALQQLVALLKQKADLEHDAIPHEHDEEEKHDDNHTN